MNEILPLFIIYMIHFYMQIYILNMKKGEMANITLERLTIRNKLKII